MGDIVLETAMVYLLKAVTIICSPKEKLSLIYWPDEGHCQQPLTMPLILWPPRSRALVRKSPPDGSVLGKKRKWRVCEKDEEAARGSLHFTASMGRNLVDALDGYTEVIQRGYRDGN